MLEIKDLCFRYGRHASAVLSGINLTLSDGEIGILLGRNGSGKTTLFNTVLGINAPSSGTIFFDGKDLSRLSRRERAGLVAYVPQHIHFGSLTVYDSVLMGRISSFGIRPGPEDYRAVDNILAEMGLGDFADRNAENLSGGEKQKIAIARAMAQSPRLLIFDEPTGNLDIANEELIIKEAKTIVARRGISILSSLHDLNQALYFGDRFFFLRDGKIKYSGDERVFTPDVIRDIFDIPSKIFIYQGKKIILGGEHYEN